MSFKCFFHMLISWFVVIFKKKRFVFVFSFFLAFLYVFSLFFCWFVFCFFLLLLLCFSIFSFIFFVVFFNILIFVCDCGICSVCSCSFCFFFLIPFWMCGLFFSVVVWYFFEFLRNFHKFSVFFARIATFRSSPLRSIPGLFNENSYDLMHTYYCDVLW